MERIFLRLARRLALLNEMAGAVAYISQHKGKKGNAAGEGSGEDSDGEAYLAMEQALLCEACNVIIQDRFIQVLELRPVSKRYQASGVFK